jgi:hypothetical protein
MPGATFSWISRDTCFSSAVSKIFFPWRFITSIRVISAVVLMVNLPPGAGLGYAVMLWLCKWSFIPTVVLIKISFELFTPEPSVEVAVTVISPAVIGSNTPCYPGLRSICRKHRCVHLKLIIHINGILIISRRN